MRRLNVHVLQHVPFESPGFIEEWVHNRGHFMSLTRFFESHQLPDVREVDMLIILGGNMSVYDDMAYPWMKREKLLIEEALEVGCWVVGICLGAQLIAQILGAKVYTGSEKEIGWFPVHVVQPPQPVFKNLPPSFTAFHWHGDTFDLPRDAKHLAYSALYENQAFVYQDNVLGLQFHLEVGSFQVEQMLRAGKNELKPARYVQEVKYISSQTGHYEQNRLFLFSVLDELIKGSAKANLNP